jgi:hypothetical protein
MKPIGSGKAMPGCPDSDELVEYFRHALPEARMAAIEEHFTRCDECLESTRTVFETLVDLDLWTARTHGEAIRREKLLAGLELAERQQPSGSDWAERLQRWRAQVSKAAAGGVELAVTASGARIMARMLGDFVATSGMRFEPVLTVRDPGTGGHAGVRSSEGNAEVLSVGGPSCRIRVDKHGRTNISLEGWPEECLNPAVLVVDLEGGHPPLLVELSGQAGGRLGADFTPAQGEYMVLFAPAESKQK